MVNKPIGFFDSGVGGVSVLRAARRLMPEEDYLYFGDSANAPYGVKSPEAVQTHLEVKEAPIADTGRYDRLRSPEIGHA